MTPKEQKAYDYFYSGYSCAMSVFAAFHEEMGLSEETALKLMLPVGGGVGGLREICGAFTAAAIVLGMIRPDADPADLNNKREVYALVQEKADAFKQEHGTYICRELLERNGITPSPVPAARTKQYYQKRPCEKFVMSCARLVEEELHQ